MCLQTKANLVTPRNGEPLIAAIQDFLTGECNDCDLLEAFAPREDCNSQHLLLYIYHVFQVSIHFPKASVFEGLKGI